MRNFVAKNDFNRGGAHKSPRDYTRVSKQELQNLAQDELDNLLWEEECAWMDSYEDQWESGNKTAYCQISIKEKL